MELAGEQIIRVPRHEVWSALNDPAVLSRCIPGCESVERVSDQEMRAGVAVKIGPVRARFAGKILLSDVEAPARCTLNFEGTGGAAGFARGRSVVELTEERDATRLTYSVEASVGGKLGQVGGRLIDSSARKMADDFFAAFREVVAPAAPAVAGIAVAEVAGEPAISPEPSIPARSPVVAAPPAPGGLWPEIHRAFWFALGAGAGLLICRFLH